MSGPIDAVQVRMLLARQFPQWAGLALQRVQSHGTDNAIFRLGDSLAVRLPRVDYASELLRKEAKWLPRLGPLPVEVPSVEGVGEPDLGFAWPWLVVRWLSGDAVSEGSIEPRQLAEFTLALQAIDTLGAPTAGAATLGRGVPLAQRDARTRDWIAAIADEFDAQTLLAIWERSLRVPPHVGPGVWVHGDLHGANLLRWGGQLTGVIDFGLAGVGDPAVDLMPAWNLFEGHAREGFRVALGAAEDLWMRGKGWALSVAASQRAQYRATNPYLAAVSARTLTALVAGEG